MKTKKIITALTFLLVVSAGALAQQKARPQHHSKERPSKEKINSLKIAYITEKLELTSDEAQKFWPIYNEFETKKDLLFAEKRQLRKVKKENVDENLSDEEIEKSITSKFKIEQKELDLDKEYFSNFKEVLPLTKVNKLYHAQEQFKKELLQKIRKGGTNDANIPPPPKKPSH
jgi:Spy/CpxP family protein refolding chaperone